MLPTQQQIRDREQEIIFTNWTEEDFVGTWNFSKNHRLYRVKAKTSVYLPFYMAETFANHLVDEELNRRKLPTNHASRQQLMDQCIQLVNDTIERAGVQEVQLREVKLRTNERSERLVNEGKMSAGDLGAYNQPGKAEAIPVAEQRPDEAQFESVEEAKDSQESKPAEGADVPEKAPEENSPTAPAAQTS